MTVVYKSKSPSTISAGRYQVNADTGVELDVRDAELDALVAAGELTIEGDVEPEKAPEAPKVVSTK